MTPEELKKSILQLAIQGKLVEQRPEEGTADDLYDQIQIEKQRLIKEGKIKKEKPLPEIVDDEMPFDIPDSWKFVYLNDIAIINGGYAFKSTDYTNIGTRVIRISDFNESGFVNTKIVRHPMNENCIPFLISENTTLLCMTGGTVGKSYYVTELPEPMMTNQRVASIKALGNIEAYINYVLLAPLTQTVIQLSKNSTNDNISMDTIKKFIVPLPPLAEINRIVAKIDASLPLVDKYADAYNQLEDLNKTFPGDLKKSILQYAIQGKLVEQRPEEGTADDLYAQIQAEKQKLIKEGKIKKEKPLPEITDDEIPFDIPDSWRWVRIGNVSWYIDAGKSPNCEKKPVVGEEFGVITTTAVQNCFFDEYQNKKLPSSFEVNETMLIHKDDVLITRAGPITRTGVACLVEDINHNLILSDKTLRINMSDFNIYKCYIVMIINSPAIREQFIIKMSGMDKQQVNISQDKIKSVIIPLPPVEEQKRIVAKFEEVLHIVNCL